MIFLGSDSAPSGGKATLDVTPISQAFQHLTVVLQGRSSYNATNVWDVSWGMQINGDSQCYYTWQQMRGNYTGPIQLSAGGVGSEVRAGLGTVPAGQAEALCSASFVVELPNYHDAIWGQNMISRGGEVWRGAEGSQAVMLYSGFYAKQVAVSRLTAILDLGNWVYGSSMYVYGWG